MIDPWDDVTLPVWGNKYAGAWPEHACGVVPMRVALGDLLTRHYETDAHFAAYSHAKPRRLSVASLAQLPEAPEMRLLVVDVDAPNKQRTVEWSRALETASRKLAGNPYGYYTRNGARLVWRVSGVRCDVWSAFYVGALVDVFAVAGIVGDPACADWPRLYRVPHGRRDGVPQRHGVVCGDPWSIGHWQAVATYAERRDARAELVAMGGHWPAKLAPREAPRSAPASAAKPSARKVLEDACNAVQRAAKGMRNAELFSRACFVGKLVRKGEIDRATGVDALVAAGVAAGLRQGEARATVASAFRRVG